MCASCCMLAGWTLHPAHYCENHAVCTAPPSPAYLSPQPVHKPEQPLTPSWNPTQTHSATRAHVHIHPPSHHPPPPTRTHLTWKICPGMQPGMCLNLSHGLARVPPMRGPQMVPMPQARLIMPNMRPCKGVGGEGGGGEEEFQVVGRCEGSVFVYTKSVCAGECSE